MHAVCSYEHRVGRPDGLGDQHQASLDTVGLARVYLGRCFSTVRKEVDHHRKLLWIHNELEGLAY